MLLPDLCLRNKTRGSLCPALVREDPLKLTAWAGVPLELYFEKEKWRGIPTTKKKSQFGYYCCRTWSQSHSIVIKQVLMGPSTELDALDSQDMETT